MKQKFILGSSSVQRQDILKEMGYEFEVISPDIDERAIRREDPHELVTVVAEAKMLAVLDRVVEDAVVITSDTIVVVEGEVCEKPLSEEEAVKFLSKFSTCPQVVISAVVVVNTKTGKKATGTDEVVVSFGEIPEQNFKDFVESKEAYKYAGALAFEHPLFLSYANEFEGELESIQGLPKTLTDRLIKEVL